MKYFVRVAGREIAVDVDGARVVVDGVAGDAHLAAVPGTPLHHLILGGRSWTVAAHALEGVGGAHCVLGTRGERFDAEVVDERTRQIQARAGRHAPAPAGGVVRAQMPGLVVRIEVSEGQRVDAGARLVVVEAMKMENELRAPHAGVVAQVHVAVGAPVEKGAILVTLGPGEGAEPRG